MSCRNVDVLNKAGLVLRTYSISISPSVSPRKPADYERAALVAAADAHLVPQAELAQLIAHMQPRVTTPLLPVAPWQARAEARRS